MAKNHCALGLEPGVLGRVRVSWKGVKALCKKCREEGIIPPSFLVKANSPLPLLVKCKNKFECSLCPLTREKLALRIIEEEPRVINNFFLRWAKKAK